MRDNDIKPLNSNSFIRHNTEGHVVSKNGKKYRQCSPSFQAKLCVREILIIFLFCKLVKIKRFKSRDCLKTALKQEDSLGQTMQFVYLLNESHRS